MTKKVYRSAQGKSVDLGTIMLKNEHTRAVGNMNINARGDKLDSMNQVVETKPQQIQKQNDRTTSNVSEAPVHTSSRKARANKQPASVVAQNSTNAPAPTPVQVAEPVQQVIAPVQAAEPVQETSAPEPHTIRQITQGGGLAGAIARTREIKQELDKTRRQSAQQQGIKKI
jgi:hypothetical protein